EVMTDQQWSHSYARCLGLLLHGDAIEEEDERGRPISDETFLLLFNAHHQAINFRLPKQIGIARWNVDLDTAYSSGKPSDGRYFHSGETYPLKARSTVLLRRLLSR
ncbi:MAG: hypothetical protein RLZ44_205, partial [Pseudomonadota bacterium]